MERLKQALSAAGIAYKENEPLSAHCTFRIGGPADVFILPEMRRSSAPPSSWRRKRMSNIICWATAATSCLRMQATGELSSMYRP